MFQGGVLVNQSSATPSRFCFHSPFETSCHVRRGCEKTLYLLSIYTYFHRDFNVSQQRSPSPNISFTDDAVPSKRPIAEELNAEKPRPCACNCRLIWILAVTATSPSNQLYGLYEQCPFNLTYTPCSSSLQTRPHQPFFLK